jgi:prepilin-type N-terminal cleavage/methylation domain-containing protein
VSVRAGFTLIEMLAVLLIVSLLVGVLVVSFGGAESAVRADLTRTRMVQVSAVLTEYEIEHGDWPRSSFGADLGGAPNALNTGGECLVLALWRKGFAGGGLDEEWLGNSDGDTAKKELDGAFADRGLRELLDSWDNPIAYFHHADYGRSDLYLTLDPKSGEELESAASAAKDPDTGRWLRATTFQLVSAGEDGRFGTEDDVRP